VCNIYVVKNHLEANVVQPKKRGKASCERCGIWYSHRDYRILKEAKKLVFIDFFEQVLCHGCFCSEAVKHISTYPRIKVLDEDTWFVLDFEDF
jgi:hypothetical protein